jgi:hypothetical protein
VHVPLQLLLTKRQLRMLQRQLNWDSPLPHRNLLHVNAMQRTTIMHPSIQSVYMCPESEGSLKDTQHTHQSCIAALCIRMGCMLCIGPLFDPRYAWLIAYMEYFLACAVESPWNVTHLNASQDTTACMQPTTVKLETHHMFVCGYQHSPSREDILLSGGYLIMKCSWYVRRRLQPSRHSCIGCNRPRRHRPRARIMAAAHQPLKTGRHMSNQHTFTSSTVRWDDQTSCCCS